MLRVTEEITIETEIITIGDVEANGLINQPSVENQQWALDWRKDMGIKGKKKPIKTNATKIHCGVFNVIDRGWFFFVPDEWIDRVIADGRFSLVGKVLSFSKMTKFLDKVKHLAGHNFHKYDIPLIKKLLDYEFKGEVSDTYVMSKTLWADRDKDGNGWTGHGLAAWGEYFGVPKPLYEEWEVFDIEMLWRCYQDVIINTKTYKHLVQEAKGWNWEPALKLEGDVCKYISNQEVTGMPFDIEQAKLYISDWTRQIDEIYVELRPMLSMEMDDAFGNSKLDVWQVKHATGLHKHYAATYRKLGKHKKIQGPDEPIKEPNYLHKKGETLKHLFTVNQSECRISSKNPQMKVRDAKGKLTAEVQKFYSDDDPVVGPFTPIIWNEPDIGSNDKLVKQLLRLGWEPDRNRETDWTDSGKPRVTYKGSPVESLEKISGTAGKLLAKYTVIKHRRSHVVGLIGYVRSDGRITSECNTGSTNTARATHSKVANEPKVDSLLGEEIRGLFRNDLYTDDGRPWVYINTDASGLEARCLANTINDEEITNLICFPQKDADGNKLDFHMVLWKVIDDFVSSRDLTKTIEYGMIYGSGNETAGRTCDIGPRPTAKQLTRLGWKQVRSGNWKHPTYAKGGVTMDAAQCIVIGAIIRKRILEKVPPLGAAMDAAKKEAEQGYIIGIDGRKLWMRQSFGKVQSHKALNTDLQSTGAIIMSKAVQFTNEECNRQGLRWQQVCFYHDETSILAHPDDAKRVGDIAEQAIRDAGKFFKLNVDLDAQAAYGSSWAETH